MYTIFQKNTGVTLIELIVVMAILGIMASITTISFGSSRDKRAVETNARQFAAVVRLAQNYALSGKQAP
ncbi:MAG: prepilin-type N-terminal cleavage/methylation domain-containing protein, partial [Candidatus Moranbacteria bacterium]|nr:prepilin-type N-terminal cleavage/methylation domain-containing protein [Candidatus Moranbacteria bacterium]